MCRETHACDCARDGDLLRPVTALRRMAFLRARNPRAPLFCVGDRPLTAGDVNGLVRFVARAAGVDPAPFSSHSLRIGGATAALAAGMSPLTTRVMGRWDSDVYEVYCRLSRQSALRVGAVVASTGDCGRPARRSCCTEKCGRMRSYRASAAGLRYQRRFRWSMRMLQMADVQDGR